MLTLNEGISTQPSNRQEGLSISTGRLGHLLLVDDDRTGVYILGQVLERAGYAVTLSTDPRHALEFDMGSFDLAIVDFDMPGCDGRELLLRMRALMAKFPILLLSGSVDALPRETRVLFSRCIAKPICTQVLLEAVAGFLDKGLMPDCC